ncbi:MAG: hypothetical protein KBT34_05380 [Prevotella sp.]|nr:hypothetical protein [Candidatus Prevotella equi]
MELVFRKIEGSKGYEAFCVAYSDFNLHLERNDTGSVTLYQSTTERGEKTVHFHVAIAGEAFDKDFKNAVYPKFIRIVSSSLVRNALVNFSNGGDIPGDIEKRLADLEKKSSTQEQILSTADLDGNGIPDGEDRLNRLESETEGMTEQEVSDVWNDVFRENN